MDHSTSREICPRKEALNITADRLIARALCFEEGTLILNPFRKFNTYTYVPDSSNALAVQDSGSDGHPELMVPWGEGESNATDPTDHSKWFIWPDSTFDKPKGSIIIHMYTNTDIRPPDHAI